MPFADPEVRSAYHKAYNEKNRDRINAQSREWRQSNLKYVQAYDRQRSKLPHRKALALVNTKRWRDRNPEAQHAKHIKRKYKISAEQYAELLQKQNGVCAICNMPETAKFNGKTKQLAVDHNHQTLALRELLCDRCNRAIGFMQENPKRLIAAASYLEKHNAGT